MASGGVQVRDKCKTCNLEVTTLEKALTCDLCERWVHVKCDKIPAEIYKSIKDFGPKCSGVKWFCTGCDSHIVKVIVEMKKMAEKQENHERKLKYLEEEMTGMKEELKRLGKSCEDMGKEKEKTSVQDTVNETMSEWKVELDGLKKSYSDMAKVGLESKPTTTYQRGMQVQVNEALEREKRKNNLVIFGIEETNDEGKTKDRIKEISLAMGIEADKLVYVGRVGRNLSGTKTRLVRINCEDAEIRRKVLKDAIKLKSVLGYERTYISPDLTKVQQEQDKKLRDKLKEIRLTQKEAKINKGDIVLYENNNRKILFSPEN